MLFLLFFLTALWGTPIERAGWNVMDQRPFYAYLIITSIQVVRVLIAWAAWTWAGWIGVVVAVTLGLRFFRTSLAYFVRWNTG